MNDIARLRAVTDGLAEIIKPPRRVSVSKACSEGLYISDTDKWDAETAPYMLRPMDCTADRKHDTVCFVGPARTGKTWGMILGRWFYAATCHPQDFAVIHSTKELARDMSIRDVKRMHKHSPALKDRMTGRSKDDNTHDKTYRSGIMAVIGWPSNTQLASRTIPVMLLTDYGRWPADVDGDGSGFEQAKKRTETGGSLAMTAVESSPGCEIHPDHDEEPQAYELGKPLIHAFPPTESGVRADICPIFNNGTREWWYVPCQSCGEFYPQNPGIERFSWGEDEDPLKAAESAGTVCCWCGSIHGEKTKRIENANGVWLAEGQVISWDGKISGNSRLGKTFPSFAMGGGAAAYQTRKSIVKKYLQALHNAKLTHDENSLKFVVNADIGAPHKPIVRVTSRASAPLKRRAKPTKKLIVPQGVRFMLAAADVQTAHFEVQIIGYGPDRNRWVIDYYRIKRSAREKDGEKLPLSPSSYLEDWDQLTPLLRKHYRLEDDEKRRMPVLGVLCDSAGEDGVTDNAYAYYRDLPNEFKRRLRLVKGEGKNNAPLIEQRRPDTRSRRDRGASRGDVPVLFIETNRMKDRLAGDLARNEPGFGYVHFPDWLEDWYYKGLTREKRDKKGKWAGGSGNEPWDLFLYAEAGAIVGIPFDPVRIVRMRGIDSPDFWTNPPDWAKPWDENPLIIESDETFNDVEYFKPKEPAKVKSIQRGGGAGSWF